MQAGRRIMLWIGSIFCFVILVNPLFSQSYSLQGRVYSGNTGLEPPNSAPIPNVPVILWGANTSGIKISPPIDNTTTDGSGWYSLDVNVMVDAYDFYIIEEVDLSGYISEGATTVGGSKLTDNLIEYTFMQLTGGVKTGNKFWDKPLAPDMDVYGNSVKIDDGDTTPSSADDTDFGPADVSGGSVSKTYTIENNGTAALTISGASISGSGDFTVTSQPASFLAPDDGTTFTVKFDPGTAGTHTATVNIANNSSENPYDFAVRGTGTTIVVPMPEIDVRGNGISIPDGDTTPETADGTDMGSAEVGSGSITTTFYVHNTGTDTLTVGYEINPDITLINGQTAASFGIVPGAGSSKIPPGGSNTISVECYPLIAGTYLTTLSMVNNDADENPYDFSVRCTGFESQQYEWDFGDAPSGYPDASHKLGGPWLGNSPPDAESGTQSSPPGLGDDNAATDDEDGVFLSGALIPGQLTGINVQSNGSSQYRAYAVWIDYNGNGNWETPDELVVFAGQGATWFQTGSVSFTVPSTAIPGITYMRARVWDTATFSPSNNPLAPGGPGGPGEVEDYQVIIEEQPSEWDFGDAPEGIIGNTTYNYPATRSLPVVPGLATLPASPMPSRTGRPPRVPQEIMMTKKIRPEYGEWE